MVHVRSIRIKLNNTLAHANICMKRRLNGGPYFGSGMRRFLGDKGPIAIERLMGMVLVTVAVQMLMNGVARFPGR